MVWSLCRAWNFACCVRLSIPLRLPLRYVEESVVKLIDYWGAVAGFISATIMFYRMNIGMDQEFSDNQEIVKDPLGFAVKKTATFNEFQADSWKASDALFAAIQFRTF